MKTSGMKKSMRPSGRWSVAALLLLAVAACAGYRGGWQSVAYIGDPLTAVANEPAARASSELRPILNVPGLQLQVEIDNQSRTYDAQVYLYVVPLSVDPREAYPKNNAPGKTRVFVTVTPSEAGFVFRPSEALLISGDKRYGGAAGHEFGMWDRDWNRVRAGGSWNHKPTGDALALSEPGRRYLLSIDFDTPVPSPESREISLDLSRALFSPAHAPVPLIRFAPRRWKEGYT
jgi:hypothetical protein